MPNKPDTVTQLLMPDKPDTVTHISGKTIGRHWCVVNKYTDYTEDGRPIWVTEIIRHDIDSRGNHFISTSVSRWVWPGLALFILQIFITLSTIVLAYLYIVNEVIP